MASDEDFFTPEEQARAEATDQQISERLRALPFVPPDRPPAPDSGLIQELARLYQPQAEEIQGRLQRGWERVAQQRAQRQRTPAPFARLWPLRERRAQMKNPLSLLRISPRSSRLVALVSVLLLVVVVGGLAAGLILVRSRGGQTGQPPQPTASSTLAPAATQTPASKPTLPPAPGNPPVSGIVAIHMLDASTGWAITGQNHILRTTDGSNHWQDVTPEGIDPPQDASNQNLAYDFFSASLAWVASYIRDTSNPGGKTKFFRTINGGQTWARTTMQGDVPGQLIFVDDQHGWMFSGTGVAAGSSGADIYRTSDGGATWTKVAVAGPSTVNQPGALPFNGDKSGIGVRDAMTAWATGSQNSGAAWLYVTRDGGATWQPQTLPVPPSEAGFASTSPPTFFSAQDGILPVSFGGANDIYVTHDGGATWQSTSLLSIGLAYPQGLSFINTNQGWATDGSTLYVTSDGGQHWTKLPPSAAFQNVNVLDFVSNEIGWAIDNPVTTSGSPTLLKTTDGGQTWTAVPFSGV